MECPASNDLFEWFNQSAKVIRCPKVGFGPVLVAAAERGAKTNFLNQVSNRGG